MIMFMNSITDLINKRAMLVSIPRIATVLFILLQLIGMQTYPGGTIHDMSTTGYSFTNNFFSDMGTYVARNGEPNYLSMIIFSLSLTIVGITFSFYYLTLPNVLGKDRINYMLSMIGTLFAIGGSACLVGTGMTPSDIVHGPHVFFANNIFHCFLVTALLYTIVIFRSNKIEKRYAFGYGLFFISIFAYVGVLQYGPPASAGQSELVFQVISQKMIVGVFCFSVLHQTYGFEQPGVLDSI